EDAHRRIIKSSPGSNLLMPIADAFWHIANFFSPSLSVAVIAASAAKLLWRRELAAVSWQRLVICSAIPMALVAAAGLVIFERDGKMVTYVAMVCVCAASLWWAGFRRPSARRVSAFWPNRVRPPRPRREASDPAPR